jgi:5-methylcytosine-specific restriction protein A
MDIVRNIPKLCPSERDREYNHYNQCVIDEVIYSYLFNSLSHREIDEKIIRLDSKYSRGYLSMGILHYIGLNDAFKGLFANVTIEKALKELQDTLDDSYKMIVNSLKRYKMHRFGTFNSWEIIDLNIICKHTDKSVFNHRGSGIPIESRWFWDADGLKKHEQKNLTFVSNGVTYNAYIKKEIRGRTRLMWFSDFEKFLRKYRKDEFPILRICRKRKNIYAVEIVSTSQTDNDILMEFKNNYPVTISTGNTEGAKKVYFTNRYERDSHNRKACIKYHGTKCAACGFNYQEVYGDWGKDYIEVHHMVPLHTLDEEIAVNPITDLIPVCANCHRMIHRRRDKALTISQLKEMLNKD